jgi:hypothetical protein
MIRESICSFFGHSVDRHHVWFDSMEFRTACARCGTDLIRLPSGWKPYDAAKHDHPTRLAHPKERE